MNDVILKENFNFELAGLKDYYKADSKLFLFWLQDNNRSCIFDNPQTFVKAMIGNIQAYLHTCNEKNTYRMATLAKKRTSLKQMVLSSLGDSMQDNLLKGMVDSLYKKEVDRYKPADPDVKYLKRYEVEQLISQSSRRIGLIIKFLFYTGCRISELIGIRLNNCYTENNFVKIKIVGKGRKERILIIPENLFNELKTFFNGKQYLFETKNGGQFNRSNLFIEIRRYSRKILNKSIGCHTFRHSFGSYHIQERKIDIVSVSKYMGHSDIGTTSKFYCGKRAGAEDFYTESGDLL